MLQVLILIFSFVYCPCSLSRRSDSILRLGARWRRDCPHTQLLKFAHSLLDSDRVTVEEALLLDFLIYAEDPALLAAFQNYLDVPGQVQSSSGGEEE